MGYGQLSLNGARRYVHRLAYEVEVGPLGDRVICHRCDTPLCCNPAHMMPGTQADNLADMRAKDRQVVSTLSGASASGAKLSEDNVREIRRRYAAGGETQRALGLEFGVGQAEVWHIVHRKHWKNVA